VNAAAEDSEIKMAGTKARRDVFGWIGVFVDVVQALLFVTAMLGALYWYATTRGGLAAVVVGMAAMIFILAVCVAILLVRRKP
jgi:hypothetical protein